MTDQISFLPMLDDAEHPTWLLSGKPGMQNENGVYVENVYEFREGKYVLVYFGTDSLLESGEYPYEIKRAASVPNYHGVVAWVPMKEFFNAIEKELGNGDGR